MESYHPRNANGFGKARDLEREGKVWRNLQPFCNIMLCVGS
jgi:hypothetical protein